MSNNSLSLDRLKSYLFETIEGVKNLNDEDASPCEKCTIEQAKAISDVAGAIIDISKVQIQGMELAAKLYDTADVKTIVTELGIADTKMLGS